MSDVVLTVPPAQPQTSRSWQVWSVAKQELLYLCWALMEIALLTPVALIFMRWTRFWPAGQVAFWLLLMMLLPFNLVRFMSGLQMARKYQWRIMLVVLLLTLLLTWRALLFNQYALLDFGWLAQLFSNFGEIGLLWARILVLFLLLILTWWRGLRLVQFHPNMHSIGLRLRASILLFVPIALFPRSGSGPWGFMPFVLLYFLAGLTAVSLIRAEEIEQERSGFAASLSPRWVGTIFATSLLIVSCAALFATILNDNTLSLILQWLSPVRLAIMATATVSILTTFYLMTPLLTLLGIFLTWLMELLSALFLRLGENMGVDLEGNLDNLFNFFPVVEEGSDRDGFSIPPEATRLIVLLTMLAVVFLLVYFVMQRFRQPSPAAHSAGSVRATGSSTLEGEGIGQRLLQRFGILRRWRTAASIRQLYQAMCDAAAAAGYTRSPSETPYEYLTTLAEVWPANQPDFRLITEAYIRVRYGEIPETEEELQAIRAAWRKLEEVQPTELQARGS